jgi:hypothetical protein
VQEQEVPYVLTLELQLTELASVVGCEGLYDEFGRRGMQKHQCSGLGVGSATNDRREGRNIPHLCVNGLAIAWASLETNNLLLACGYSLPAMNVPSQRYVNFPSGEW